MSFFVKKKKKKRIFSRLFLLLFFLFFFFLFFFLFFFVDKNDKNEIKKQVLVYSFCTKKKPTCLDDRDTDSPLDKDRDTILPGPEER
jgi:hypothetical protein